MLIKMVRGDSHFEVEIALLFPDLKTPIQDSQRCQFLAQREGEGATSLSWNLEGKTRKGKAVFNMGETLKDLSGEFVAQIRLYFSGNIYLTSQDFTVIVQKDLPR